MVRFGDGTEFGEELFGVMETDGFRRSGPMKSEGIGGWEAGAVKKTGCF